MHRNFRLDQEMLFPLSPLERVKQILEYYVNSKVNLILTENTTSLLTAKKKKGIYIVRLSKIFLHANETVIKDLALFIVKKSKLTENVKCFLKSQPFYEKRERKNIKIEPNGKIFNLLEIFNQLNKQYFDGQVEAKITWGKNISKKIVRTRQLGSYNEKDKVIRINPILDNENIPLFYIGYIVYHEMLHAYLGIKRVNKRRYIHYKEFKIKEKQYLYYNDALMWEKENRLSAILRV